MIFTIFVFLIFRSTENNQDYGLSIFIAYFFLIVSIILLCFSNKNFWVYGGGFMVIGTILLAVILNILRVTNTPEGYSFVNLPLEVENTQSLSPIGSSDYWVELLTMCFIIFGLPVGTAIGLVKSFNNTFVKVIAVILKGACFLGFIPIIFTTIYVTFGVFFSESPNLPSDIELSILLVSLFTLVTLVKYGLFDTALESVN